MDENLIRYAIQFSNRARFEDRYRLYANEEDRNREFNFLASMQDAEAVEKIKKVKLFIRVETEY